jgi:D-alanyl-D-alanine carboxypeptidase/D-alanyl-D-alanine-endopeptidase (penicillin-binding protein 4)
MKRAQIPLPRDQFWQIILPLLFALVTAKSVGAVAGQPPATEKTHHVRALDRRIDALLRESDARRGFWGMEVVDSRTGRLLYSRASEHLFLPASNMKLFTTSAALQMLGPDFIFRTTVESDVGPDAQGRIETLYLVGRGDPELGPRTFPYKYKGPKQPVDTAIQQLADQVKARGVREVTGRLVADDSYFIYEPFANNWAADDLQWGYGAPVTALAFNDNSLTLHMRPGAKAGDQSKVWLEPLPDYYTLKSRLETGAAGTQNEVYVERIPGSMELDVWGQIALDAGEQKDTVSIANPPLLIGELFRQALETRGIKVDGPVEVRHLKRLEAVASTQPSANPPARIILAEHDSPPLSEEIKVINKESQNLHAEMLLRTIARERKNYGSLTVGLEVLKEFLGQVGIDPGETFFSDGSGLSREDLVTPHAIVKLLLYMSRSPNFKVLFASLPVSGEDGTLQDRLQGPTVAGRIHAKTGSVEHVNALSGYMDLPSGRRLVFSILANNHPLKERVGAATLDQIVRAVYRHFSRRR